jgi:hypothetical protein
MTNPTFADLLRKARRLPLTNEVWHILASAETNANDTADTACTEHELERIALNSIAVLLDDTKPATRAWFTRQGYRW